MTDQKADSLLERTKKFCDRYADDLSSIFPNTRVHFILHYRSQKSEKITRLLPEIQNHPAYEEAVALLKFRAPVHENSSFLGMAIGFRKSMLGLKKIPECLAFISINLNQHETEEDLHLAIHSLTANYLETIDFYSQKSFQSKSNQILQPKRNNIATCRSNLKSDVYSVLNMAHQGYDTPADILARKRAEDTLMPRTSHPENFPYPIALDVTNFAMEKFMARPKKSAINSAYTLARHVAGSFSGDNIENWITFAGHAQTMAWSGFRPEQILSAAIHHSSNPFLKSTAHMLSDILKIEPVPIESLPNGFNPFALPEVNFIEHERSVEETFEMVLIHAMEADSHLPMIHVANSQNEGLLKGRFSGWCAHALQSAATAYNNAQLRGMPSDQAARLEFQSAKQQTGWKELNQIGAHVVQSRRNGDPMTMSGLSKWCEKNTHFKPIAQALTMTLADPEYNMKLQATVEMPTPSPALAAAAAMRAKLSYDPDFAPVVGFAPTSAPAPGGIMGGGGGLMAGGIVSSQRHQMHNTETSTDDRLE